MFLINRLITEYRMRGPGGLVRFLISRIARTRADLLFEMDLAGNALPIDAAQVLPALMIGRENLGSADVADVLKQVLVGDNVQYRDGLTEDDLLFVALDEGGKVVSYAFVLFRSRYKRVLGIDDEVPLIANCFTEPEMRGRRLYPRLLVRVCQELAGLGYTRATISCEPDNVASIRGITRAGFTGLSHIRSVIVLWKIVMARRVESYASWLSKVPANPD